MEYAGGTYQAPSNSNYYTVKSGDTIFMGDNEYEKNFKENLSKFGLRFAFTMV